jgi:hypothetical protein
MIPVDHGVPNWSLTPWARLWRNKRVVGYSGQLSDSSRLELYPRDNGEWQLLLGWGDVRKPLATLHVKYREDGVPYLSGMWGLSHLVALANPWDKGPRLTLYTALTPRAVA